MTVADEASALAAAATGWFARVPVVGLPCALVAEHLSGAHLRPGPDCPACRLTQPDAPPARLRAALEQARGALPGR